MIKYIKGDLFEADVDAFAHGCNTGGKMGAGIAREFKRKFPQMYKDYKARCAKAEFNPGEGYIYLNERKPHIINLATQASLGGAEIEFVDNALRWLAKNYQIHGLKSIAMPKIASGLGRLNWELDIKPILHKYFDNENVLITVYYL